MRGFPPLQIFILGLLFGLLAVPMVQLTGNAPVPATSKPGGTEVAAVKTTIPALLRLRYAHRPLTISLKSDARELVSKPDMSSSPIELETEITLSKDGNEFSLEASWPPGTPDTALTVEIEPDGQDPRTVTLWSSGSDLSEILTLSW